MHRRTFVATVTAASGLAAIGPDLALGQGTAPWDLTWLDHMRGRHKQVFDLGTIDDPLVMVKNYLDAHRDVYRLEFPQINTVVGIAGKGFPINFSDAVWAKYTLGERWSVKDPAGGGWATRNVFAADATALRARGTIFWQCNNALNRITRELATAVGAPLEAVRGEIVAGLLPGVHLVPAHTMAIGLAQERGCTYQRV